MKIRLTKQSVDVLPPPPAGNVAVWDRDLAGFGVRVSATGRKTFFVHKRTTAGRQVQLTIGVLGEITADEARKLAGKELARLASGLDPVEEKRQARAEERARRALPTVAGLADRFIAEHVEVHDRPRTVVEYRALIDRHIKPRLGDVQVPDVEHADIEVLHRDLKATPYVANRVLAVLSKMFSLAVVWELRPDHPVKDVRRYPEEKRQRFLSSAELGRLAQALGNHHPQITANAIRMLLLTGARRSEVLGMTWKQVETEPGIWIKPSALTKQKALHRVPLSPGACQLLEEMKRFRKPGEPYVFPGRGPGEPLTEVKKSWATVCEKAGISDVRIHDLRHTYASILVSSGASLPLIGGLLGHTQPQTTARYAHLATDPLQEATNRVDTLLAALGKSATAEVTPLRKRP